VLAATIRTARSRSSGGYPLEELPEKARGLLSTSLPVVVMLSACYGELNVGYLVVLSSNGM
jgi:hypothetical protein